MIATTPFSRSHSITHRGHRRSQPLYTVGEFQKDLEFFNPPELILVTEFRGVLIDRTMLAEIVDEKLRERSSATGRQRLALPSPFLLSVPRAGIGLIIKNPYLRGAK